MLKNVQRLVKMQTAYGLHQICQLAMHQVKMTVTVDVCCAVWTVQIVDVVAVQVSLEAAAQTMQTRHQFVPVPSHPSWRLPAVYVAAVSTAYDAVHADTDAVKPGYYSTGDDDTDQQQHEPLAFVGACSCIVWHFAQPSIDGCGKWVDGYLQRWAMWAT